MKKKIWLSILLVALLPMQSFAAVGCDLNDPDRDVKRLFPHSTSYKTIYKSIGQEGGDALLQEVEKRLGDNFTGLFETAEVPYTVYEIYQGKKLLGYIHGVNQKGKYGGIQVVLALDTQGVIQMLYFQKLTSQEAGKFREKNFGQQFKGLAFKDFENYDVKSTRGGSTALRAIRNPAPQAEKDFYATLRAIKKNLILMDVFILHQPTGKGA
jgi:hypothetical protein